MIYTVDEIAEILKINPRTVTRYIKTGRLKAVKLGRMYRIKAEALETFLKEKTICAQY